MNLREDAARFVRPSAIVAVILGATVAIALWTLSVVGDHTSGAVKPALAESADHGASFAAPCDHAVQRREDPYRGTSGADSHLHEFFGATDPHGDSTRGELRGQTTTCQRELHQTSSYWMPAVRWRYEDASGATRYAEPTMSGRQNDAVIYYRHGEKNHQTVKPFPAGVKMLASAPTTTYNCDDGGEQKSSPPDKCSTGRMEVRFKFPDCWDANQAQNPDGFVGRMAYARERADGSRTCEGVERGGYTYERPMAQITMNVLFESEYFKRSGGLQVSVDEAMGSWTGSGHMHADFFNAWDQAKLNNLTENCINKVPPTKPRPDFCQAPDKTSTN